MPEVERSTLYSPLSSPFIPDRSRASDMADDGPSTESTLIFAFLVAFLGIFALGVTGGIAWPRIRRSLATRFGIFQTHEEVVLAKIGRQPMPQLWTVCVRDVVKSTEVLESAWEHLRASVPLLLLRL